MEQISIFSSNSESQIMQYYLPEDKDDKCQDQQSYQDADYDDPNGDSS